MVKSNIERCKNMTVYCDCKRCEYHEDEFCDADRLELDENGICMSCRYTEEQDNEGGTEQE